MKLADLPIIKVRRVMSAEDATNMVGTTVPDLEPNCRTAALYIDAETEEAIMAYMPMEDEVNLLRRSVLGIKYGTTKRAGTGMENQSRTFGMAPRKVFQRRESCRTTTLANEQPEEHAVLVAFATKFGEMFKEFAPHLFEQDEAILERSGISNEWKMTDDALWTSGVINKASTLPYHRDGFNFSTWSAMPVVRRDMKGGYLNFIEYGLTCACRDGWVLFFPGYKYVHGVTPMTPTAKDAYRYSIVYYALRGMKDCFTFAVETARGAENRTKREEKMAEDIKNPANAWE